MSADEQMAGLDPLQIDLATAIVRIEQAYAEAGTALGDILLMRLATCDAPRLRRHLTPAAAALLDRQDT